MSRGPAPLVDLGRGRAWAAPWARLFERLLALDQVDAFHRRLEGRGPGVEAYCGAALAELGVRVHVRPGDLARLQAVQGPCLVLANHPLGGRDALALMGFLAQARPTFRLLANRLLGAIPELVPSLILVDPFGAPSSVGFNLRPLRQAHAWLAQGGLLGLFPAGEVSLWQGGEGRVADKAWSPQVVKLARSLQATVLPLHISGASSAWLQALARLHPSLKTPFLARELMRGPARELTLTLGNPLAAAALPHADDPGLAAAWLRRQAYGLGALPAS